MTRLLSENIGTTLYFAFIEVERSFEPLSQTDSRLPPKQGPSLRNVRAPTSGIILRQGFESQFALRSSYLKHRLRAFKYCELVRIANVYRHVLAGARETPNSFNQVIDVAEAARLAAVSIHGKRTRCVFMRWER